jgi:drug/metabolite transporter (DMT)-like permease
MTLSPRLALLMTLPPLLWTSNAVLGRLLVGHIGPLGLNALRWALALLVLLPLGWRETTSSLSSSNVSSRANRCES